jgi:YD repeat-containing protein
MKLVSGKARPRMGAGVENKDRRVALAAHLGAWLAGPGRTARRLVRLLCLLALASWAGAAAAEDYDALQYYEVAGWVPAGPDPASVCAAYASVWGWDKAPYSASILDDLAGRWKCQRYNNGALEPSEYTYIQGACQDSHATSLSDLSGKYVSYPQWGLNTGKCSCPNGRFKRDIEWCIPQCAWNQMNASDTFACVGYGDRTYNKPGMCPKLGDPIYPLTGSRRQDVDLGLRIGGQPLTLVYDTAPQVPEAAGGSTWLLPAPASFGSMWQSSLHKSLVLQSQGNVGAAYSSAAMQRGGSWETATVAGFDSCTGGGGGGNAYVPTVNANEKVQFTGTGSAGSVVDGSALTEEAYDQTGAITTLMPARGGQLTFGYDSGLLKTVTDQFGRQVQFSYEQPANTSLPQRIYLVTAPDGSTIQVGYDSSNNLKTLTWADTQVRTFVYENASLPWALTGIVDESKARYGTYGYDAQGRATSTYLGDGAEKYSVTYSAPPMWSVTETRVSSNFVCREHRWVPPTGTQVTTPQNQLSGMGAVQAKGMVALASQSQPAGSGCAASSSAQSYDAQGNPTSRDDFNGNRTCNAYDPVRNLRVVTLEGRAAQNADGSDKPCPADLASYTPSAADAQHPERKTTVQWHPDWALEARRAEPKKITTWVYNGQPDPIAGDTPNCAPSAPALLDGKPIAVVCRRYEQATSDPAGGAAFAATPVGVARLWSYTYDQNGQLLTETAPKLSPTDTLSHTTNYTYYTDTSFPDGASGHTVGDLQQVQDPAGNATQFTLYDKAGRLLSSKDANNTVTTRTWWPRGWVHTVTVKPKAGGGTAQTTTYDYWPTGLLHVVTQPDGSTLTYAYDDAHRLTDVTDGAGNTVHYVLDGMGNRTSETVKDASGNLASAIARIYDNLNRLQAVTGAAQ